MTGPDESYALLALMFAVGLGFCLAMLGLARIWSTFVSPAKPGPSKNAAYECGIASRGEVRVQFRSQYYLYAIIFLIFDVEAIFLLPFAVSFTTLSAGAFAAIMIFLLLLAEGLAWAWMKGVLAWR